MNDTAGKIKFSLIFFGALMALAIVCLLFSFSANILMLLMPPLTALAAALLCFGLSFVPFFKEREVLLIPIAAVFSLTAGILCHFLI